jgi:SP family general alpha glucoside:H+ symporter-like MFS transporter
MIATMPPIPTRKPVSKACDACRRRKIKCNGLQPCAGCNDANLACTFDAPRGQGGNRGARATVLNQLRGMSGHHEMPSEVLQSPNLSIEPSKPALSERNVLDKCMAAYAAHVHPVVPLLDVEIVKAQALQAESSLVSQRFIRAFCAYVSNFRRVFEGSEVWSSHLLNLALTNQPPTHSFSQPSPLAVYTSFFLYGASAGHGDYQQAWYYLREATTLFMMLRSTSEAWYNKKAQRCLFWILVVSERCVALVQCALLWLTTSQVTRRAQE